MEQAQRPARYGTLAIALHWIMFALVAVMFVLAWMMFTAPEDDPAILPTIRLHKSIGVTVLVLALLRIAWRLFNPPPAPPADIPGRLVLAAGAVHGLLYLLLIAVPVAGWLNSSSAGISVTPFGLFSLPDLVEKSRPLHELLEQIHVSLALTLLALIALHAVAGLYHHLVRRDDILTRMIPFLTPLKARS